VKGAASLAGGAPDPRGGEASTLSEVRRV